MQAKSRKGAVKETRTEVHVASASLSPCSGLPYSHSFQHIRSTKQAKHETKNKQKQLKIQKLKHLVISIEII
jgi:hypothetical protein